MVSGHQLWRASQSCECHADSFLALRFKAMTLSVWSYTNNKGIEQQGDGRNKRLPVGLGLRSASVESHRTRRGILLPVTRYAHSARHGCCFLLPIMFTLFDDMERAGERKTDEASFVLVIFMLYTIPSSGICSTPLLEVTIITSIMGVAIVIFVLVVRIVITMFVVIAIILIMAPCGKSRYARLLQVQQAHRHMDQPPLRTQGVPKRRQVQAQVQRDGWHPVAAQKGPSWSSTPAAGSFKSENIYRVPRALIAQPFDGTSGIGPDVRNEK